MDPIHCSPAGGRHSGAIAEGASVIGSDPDVESVGVDAGFTPEPGILRAPDVAVGVSDSPGWSPGVPPLALEYADRGQDEDDLTDKIRDLLAAGTHTFGSCGSTVPGGSRSTRPTSPCGWQIPVTSSKLRGVLRNPVPVEALYDKQAPQRVTLRNLLQRYGYENLDAVLDEGKALGVAEGRAQGVAEGKAQGVAEGEAQGRRSSLLELCEAKGLELSDDQRIRISTCTDLDQLKAWVKRAITAETADALFD